MHAKFEVSSLNPSQDTEGSHNFKSRSRDPFPTPFDLIFHFFIVSAPGGQSASQIWSFWLKSLPRYGVGPKITKVGHVTPSRLPLTQFFIFIVSAPVVNMHAKFEVFSSNRSRDMEGVPKFQK